MKRIHRTVSAALFLVLCAALTASCGNEAQTAQTGNSQTPDTAPSESESVSEDPRQQTRVTQEYDYGGRTYMLLGGDAVFEHYTQAESLNGDSMNDSLFLRYQAVSDKINVKFEFLQSDSSGAVKQISSSVLAGDDSFQLAFVQRATQIGKMVGEHYLSDWNTFPYIDLSQEFWYQDAIASLQVDEHIFYTYGDIYPLSAHCFMFNQQILQSYDLPNPYELVRNGQWTMAKLQEMASAAVKDLDGNGKMDENDQYGISYWNADCISSFMYGQGVTITQFADNTVQLTPCDDKMIAAFNNILPLFENNISYTGNKSVTMENGTVLFYIYCVHDIRKYRDSPIDFGLLPYPKFDEAQENYISFLNTELMCVPSTADPELSGVCIQLLAENSYGVKDAYYEQLMKEKVSRDPESAEMLDIIFRHAVNDFAISFCDGAALYTIPSSLAKAHKSDFVSSYEKKKSSALKSIDKALTQIYSNED